jgi:protein SCO1
MRERRGGSVRSIGSALMIAILLFVPSVYAKDFPDNSIFHLQGEWQNPEGKKVKLSELEGRVNAVAMVYTSCQYSCPLIIEEFNKIKSKISAQQLQKIRFVLISMDPKRDTPEALRNFAAKRSLDLSLWRLYTSKTDRPVREFSAVIGANIKKVGDEFAHSNLIIILGPDGVIEFSKTNLGQQLDETAAVIEKLASKITKL